MLIHIHGAFWAGLSLLGFLVDVSQMTAPISLTMFLYFIGLPDLWVFFLAFSFYASTAKLIFVFINRGCRRLFRL